MMILRCPWETLWWKFNIQPTQNLRFLLCRQAFPREMPCFDAGATLSGVPCPYDDCGNATLSFVALCSRIIWLKSLHNQKWFKPAACHRAEDAFWDPKEGCIKNQSDLMLDAALMTDNDLYWEPDTTKPPSPKWKWLAAEEESLDNLISIVKMAMSVKKLQNQCSNPLCQRLRPHNPTQPTRKAGQPGLLQMHKWWHHKSPPYHNWPTWSWQFNLKTKWLCLILILCPWKLRLS